MTEWNKHDQSHISPVDIRKKVQVETYASLGKDIFFAYEIDWRNVKWYKIVKDD
jgi:hypothetical protein